AADPVIIEAPHARATAVGQDWDEGLYYAEREALGDLLRDIFNPFRPLPPLPPAILALNDSVAVKLAARIYEERDFSCESMGVLADALEEAGCQDADILGHLRSPGPHVRGCWAVDLLLGKE